MASELLTQPTLASTCGRSKTASESCYRPTLASVRHLALEEIEISVMCRRDVISDPSWRACGVKGINASHSVNWKTLRNNGTTWLALYNA